jgi:hypothetical protein
MFQLPGLSSSGNKPSTIGTTVSNRAWNAVTQVQRIAYGGGVFFGGRGAANLCVVAVSPSSGTVVNLGLEGMSNSAQQPSYSNGYAIQPISGSAFLYTTTPTVSGSWASRTVGSLNQINKVFYVSSANLWIAVIDGNTPFISTTGINGTYSARTYTGSSISSTGSADTDGTRIVFGSKAGVMRYADGNGTVGTAITSPFGTGTIRTIRYHAENQVWTGTTNSGLVGYTADSTGATGWTLITTGFSVTSDSDIFFINNRWVAVASNGSGSQIQFSTSATSSITSAFTANSIIGISGTDNSAGSYATDGNWICGTLGTDLVYTR